ncbi:TonB-dependent receptor [Pedobacter sp. MC2016-05]|uniref:SusC/RagA family TonB-linked outer membrane protein n=1 Tax=Pedobacter sp. MC2016-05 TaxID=2994474 RepID=UPI00224838F0|nr:TonB-dependent receptor [Pedobacter sp. MC2016-05]MCX2472806.1 TonB-dependent receptor [Pedobacter sp. MC2016-05]
MKKLLQSLFILLFIAGTAIAQERTITGTVTGKEDGLPLPGVSVKIKGASGGTTTGANGKYTLRVTGNATALEFTYIGYSAQTRAIGAGNSIDVMLVSDAKTLTDVVVTGYGTIQRKSFTGASSTVNAAQIANKPVQSFGQGLVGQATGVSIVQPNGLLNNPPVIRVRGLSSLSLSSFPLVVVDGIPISTSNTSQNSAANNPLGDINPEDIETIDILKDAASTAIYGSRGAAGVLIITTKKGKQGQTKFSYDAWAGVSNAVRLPEVMDAGQYIAYKNQAVKNLKAVNPTATVVTDANGNSFFPNLRADGSEVNTNWNDVIYRSAVTQNHNVSLSSATEKTSYFISGGLSDQQGFLRGNNFKRYTGRANVIHQATSFLKLNMNLAYTNTYNQSPNSGSAAGGAFASSGLGRLAFALSPNLRPFNDDGSYSLSNNGTVGNGPNLVPTSWSNPQVLIERDRNTSETTRIIANLGAEIKLTKDLSVKSSFSWDRGNTENYRFWNPLSGDGFSTTGSAYNNNNRRNNKNFINTINYNKTFGGLHNLSLIAGNEAQSTTSDDWGAQRTTLSDPFYTQFQGQFTNNTAAGNGLNATALESYLAIANYNFDNKYFINGNFRRDGNSGLSPEKRWGNFGGGSLAWDVSKEAFFANSSLAKIISNLRIRGSYGVVGNAAVGAYNFFSTYDPTLYGETGTGFLFNRAGNADLGWETSKQTDVGINIAFLNNRFSLEVDYFNKNIDGLILNVPQAPSKGIPGGFIRSNVGSMYNRGFEFALNAAIFREGNFKWNSTLNFTTIKNMVTALDPQITQILTSTSDLEQTSITIPGYSAAQIYGVKTNGVNPANGRRIFVDRTGREIQYLHQSAGNGYTYVDNGLAAPSPASQQQILGNTLPTWYGGFNNNMSYGNFDLSLNFTFSGGNYIYNGSRAGLLDQRFWNNSVEVVSNAWSPTNTSGTIPFPVFSDNVSNGSSYLISENVEKGDFLRLQTATLGYRLPKTIFGKSGISSLRVYGQVNNAFLITGYTGVDPEISSNGDTNLASGIERNSIPQGRVFTFGISLGL